MSTLFGPQPIRILCDLDDVFNVVDLNTTQPPQWVDGDDIEIDIGIGQYEQLLTSLTTSGAGGILSITMQVFVDETSTGAPVLTQTTSSLNTALTQAEWNDDTTPYYFANFLFSNTLTALLAPGSDDTKFWMRIFVLTSDTPSKRVTICEGSVLVKAAPVNVLAAAIAMGWALVSYNGLQTLGLPDGTGNFYALDIDTDDGVRSVSLSDAPCSTINLPASSGWKTVVNNGVPSIALLDQVTQNYYALEIDTNAGVRSVSLSDTAY